MERRVEINRPPLWLLALAGTAVVVGTALLLRSWRLRYKVGYSLGSVVAVVLAPTELTWADRDGRRMGGGLTCAVFEPGAASEYV